MRRMQEWRKTNNIIQGLNSDIDPSTEKRAIQREISKIQGRKIKNQLDKL